MGIPLRQYFRLLSHYLRPMRPRVLLLTFFLVAVVGLQLLNPQVLRQFIDSALGAAPMTRLFLLAGLFIAMALAAQALNVASTWLSESIAWTATNALRADLFDHTLRLDMSFHKSRTPGEMIQRIDADVDALSSFFSQLTIQVFSNGALLVGIIVLLFIEDVRIGLAMSAFAIVSFFVMLYIRSYAVPRWQALREANALFYGFLAEHLAGTEDIRANGARPYVMRRFFEMKQRWFPAHLRAQLAGTHLYMVSIALFGLGNAIALGLGAYLWTQGDLTLGGVYLVFHYTELLRLPIEQIRTQLQELQSAEASIRRVDDLMKRESRIKDGPGTDFGSGALSLEFADVTFEYDPDAPVLRDVRFELRPGTVLGVLGRTGSGKTTLGRLVARLYDATAGSVLVNGHDLRELKLEELRSRIGIVTQDVQLFDAPVRENLTFFDLSLPDERLIEVIEEVGLTSWFRALPAGLDTEIEAGGLSAGEAQLLAFARVFLRNPGLVILDEASSRLDPATERLIEQAVSRLLEGRTAIIIAHRLSTIERVDEVLVLEDGAVVEHGRRSELLADPSSRYYALLEKGQEALLA